MYLLGDKMFHSRKEALLEGLLVLNGDCDWSLYVTLEVGFTRAGKLSTAAEL